MRWIPIVMVVAGNVAYHLGQKMVPRGAHPLVATLGMYVVAALATLLMLPLVPPAPTRAGTAASVHWSVAVIGVAIVAIEVGFLLAYRNGWPISRASITAGSMIALCLLPIGLLAFGEHLSASRLLGFGFCLTGLWLLNRG